MNTKDNIRRDDIDETLRPSKLAHFIGQEKIKEGLDIFISAAKKRQEPLAHVLIYGAPGLGKTTLAKIISKELGSNYTATSGPALERQGDLAAIISNLSEGDVFFIDEIHRLGKPIEEMLYSAMEDFTIDIVFGKGPSAHTVKIDLPKFTLIGATTKMGMLSSPLRDRFGVVYQLGYYTENEIDKIIKRSAKILNISIDPLSTKLIADRSRKTPRIANRILQRIRDYAEVKGDGIININNAKEALQMLSIDEFGLDETDRKILKAIASNFSGGPVGLNALSAATSQDQQTLEEVVEPFLLQLGFINRTPQGRKITDKGLVHLGLSPKGML